MPETEITIVQDKTPQVIQSAVDKLVNLIKPTYGPATNKVIINKLTHRLPVDDGVQIARDFEIKDNPAEAAVVNVVKETAIKTNDLVGDGTTGALIMLQGIIRERFKRHNKSGREIELELKKALQEFKVSIRKDVKEIKTKEELEKVALVSFDDKKIATMIADLYWRLGDNGKSREDVTITVDKSKTMETYAETSDGCKITTGYISPYMVTNQQRMETELENPYILLTDYRLTEDSDLLPIMDKVVKEKGRLVVIAENVEQSALSTMVINLSHVINPQTQKRGIIQSVAISIPKEVDRTNFLEDLALLTGARVFSVNKGDKLDTAELKDLGRADKFICRRDESILVGPRGKKAVIATAITSLRTAIDNEKDQSIKNVLQTRLGMFTNSIAVIKVGAATDNEQKALKYKVDDAVNAVRAAYVGGVVCGSGLALARVKTSSSILNEALQYPARQLRENMGLDYDVKLKEGEAHNVVTGKTGPFLEVGVIDPVDVLIAGVESAVSIASILITSSGILVETAKQN